MTQLRELESSHHEKVTEIGLQYLERLIKGTLEEDPPDELRKVGRALCVLLMTGSLVYTNTCSFMKLQHFP